MFKESLLDPSSLKKIQKAGIPEIKPDALYITSNETWYLMEIYKAVLVGFCNFGWRVTPARLRLDYLRNEEEGCVADESRRTWFNQNELNLDKFYLKYDLLS
jgi:hypothetical protein